MSKWNEVLTGIVTTEERSEFGVTVTSFTMSGERYANGIVAAVAEHYHSFTERPRVTRDTPTPLDAKVSVLALQDGMFGHLAIQTLAGTLKQGSNGDIVIIPKGGRTKGYSMTRMIERGAVLDIEPGFSGEKVLSERTLKVREMFPEVVPLTKGHFQQLPERGEMISLAVFGSYRFVTGPIRGAIWLLHSYLPEDGILEGVLLVPPSEAFSEHGSIYDHELLRMAVGVVKDFPAMSLDEALALTDADYEEVLTRLRVPAAV